MKALLGLIRLLALIALVLFGIVLFREHEGIALTRDARPYSVNEPELAGSIQGTLNSYPKLDVSVSIVDLQTGKRYHYGENASYGSASIGKLISAAAYLHLVESGRASLDEMVDGVTGQQQLQLMITKSDNTAWRAINHLLTPAGLKAYALSLGLDSYEPSDNLLTTDDVALFLDKLSSYRLLSNAHTDLLLSLMEQANMRDYIVAGVPPGAQTYHKVGYLQDRLHDAAIIKKAERAYVLVIFSKSNGVYDFSKGSELFQATANRTALVFFGN